MQERAIALQTLSRNFPQLCLGPMPRMQEPHQHALSLTFGILVAASQNADSDEVRQPAKGRWCGWKGVRDNALSQLRTCTDVFLSVSCVMYTSFCH